MIYTIEDIDCLNCGFRDSLELFVGYGHIYNRLYEGITSEASLALG